MNPVLRALLILVAFILFGIAVLTGGCSILFTPALFDSGEFSGSGILPIWATGLAIGGACLWAAIALIRRLRRPPPPSAKTFEGEE